MDEAKFLETLCPEAESRVSNDLLLEKVAEVEGLEVSDEEVEEEFKKMAESYKMEIEDVKKYLSAEDVRTNVLYNKASKIITESAIPVKFESKASEEAAEAPEEKPAEGSEEA